MSKREILRRAEDEISSGTVHKFPSDLKKALLSKPKTLTSWEDITPLARNEWICWVESVKREETRREHVERTAAELIEGKRLVVGELDRILADRMLLELLIVRRPVGQSLHVF